MKKGVLIGVLAAAVVGAGAVGYVATRPTDEELCWEVIKEDLRDPITARLEVGESWVDKGEMLVVYYAKNGFGVYGKGYGVCAADEDGRFDAVQTSINRAKESIRQSEERIKQLESGQ